jgi:multidrug efflux pump subunit AcrA (membrane-fusion protein)
VKRRGAHGTVIPYDAVLYGPEGDTFTYTSPDPLVFVRHAITVDRIAGDRALLSSGPPPGTEVVTVGSQELFGTEHDVEDG